MISSNGMADLNQFYLNIYYNKIDIDEYIHLLQLKSQPKTESSRSNQSIIEKITESTKHLRESINVFGKKIRLIIVLQNAVNQFREMIL